METAKTNGNNHLDRTGYLKEVPIIREPKATYRKSSPVTPPASDNLQPHNIEAEEALLGSIIISADALIEVIDIGIVPADFYIERNGWIFDAMLSLFEKGSAPDNLLTLSDELTRRGQLQELGGTAYVTGLMNATPSHLHAGHYAGMVKRCSVLRQLISASGKIARLAHNTDAEAGEILQQANDIFLAINQANTKSQPASLASLCEGIVWEVSELQKNPGLTTGLPSGLSDLDRVTGGFQPGDLIYIGGRPGTGKTSMALQFACHAAEDHNARCLIFSLEMPKARLARRLVASKSRVPTTVMRTGSITKEQYSDIIKASMVLGDLSVAVDDRVRTALDIRAKAIAHKAKYGLDFIVIDYLQRISAGRGSDKYSNRNAEVGAISRQLKDLALDLNIPILCISSLSRKCEERADKRPMASDMRESGDIEYDADTILALYRESMYNPETEFPNIVELIILKQRDGETGAISVYFKPETTTFCSLDVRRQSLNY